MLFRVESNKFIEANEFVCSNEEFSIAEQNCEIELGHTYSEIFERILTAIKVGATYVDLHDVIKTEV